MSKQTMYNPPTVKEMTLLELEPLLLSTSADMGRFLVIEGQQTDGYFESDDIGAVWGWD